MPGGEQVKALQMAAAVWLMDELDWVGGERWGEGGKATRQGRVYKAGVTVRVRRVGRR